MAPLFCCTCRPVLLLFATAGSLFGSLEGVDLEVFNLDLNLDVGSEVADAVGPFFGRCRIGAADLTDGAGDDPFTPFTVFYDGLTGTFGKYTTLVYPKRYTRYLQVRFDTASFFLLQYDSAKTEVNCSNFEKKKSTPKTIDCCRLLNRFERSV